jgi:hypothetical protein
MLASKFSKCLLKYFQLHPSHSFIVDPWTVSKLLESLLKLSIVGFSTKDCGSPPLIDALQIQIYGIPK